MHKTAVILTVAALMAAGAALAGCESLMDREGEGFAPAYPDMLGSNPIYCRDTISAAKAHGIDYRSLVNSCLGRDAAAMRRLFWLSSDAPHLGGAAAEGHACFVGFILSRTGDAFFSECLARESGAVQDAVRRDLLQAAGYDTGNKEKILPWLRTDYPRVFPETWKPR